MAEPSAMMLEAFERLGCGSPTLTCYCGRVHHAPASDFIEPGEETQMRADAEKNPNSVQLHDGDGVSAMMIQGVPIVYGCKCNWLGKLEAIIWGEREYILKYYKLRRDAAAKDAQALSTALETRNVPEIPPGSMPPDPGPDPTKLEYDEWIARTRECPSCHGQGCEPHECDDGRLIRGPGCARCEGAGRIPL